MLSIWYSRKVPKEIVGEERESQIWRLDRARTVSSVLWPRLGSPEGEIYERIGGRDRREEREKVRVKERV